jgi:hypothetical protein
MMRLDDDARFHRLKGAGAGAATPTPAISNPFPNVV